MQHRCSLKVLLGRRAQITEAVRLGSGITGEQVELLSLTASAGGSLPSYKKALGFILCNFFFPWKENSMNSPRLQMAPSSGW